MASCLDAGQNCLTWTLAIEVLCDVLPCDEPVVENSAVGTDGLLASNSAELPRSWKCCVHYV